MTKVYRKEKFVSGVPGQTFHMQAGKLKSIDRRAPFLATRAARHLAVAREGAGADPATTRPRPAGASWRAGELDQLRAALDEFAGALVGGIVFRGLCSLLVERVRRARADVRVRAARRPDAPRVRVRAARVRVRAGDEAATTRTSPASSAGRAISLRCSPASSGRSR